MRIRGRGLALPVDVAPGLQCSALAERPGPPAHWTRRGPCRMEGRGRRQPLVSWLTAASAGSETRGTPRLCGDPAPPPFPSRTPSWQTLASDKPGFQLRLSHCQFCRSDLGYSLILSSLYLLNCKGGTITPISHRRLVESPKGKNWAKLLAKPYQLLIPSCCSWSARQAALSLETELPALSRPPSAIHGFRPSQHPCLSHFHNSEAEETLKHITRSSALLAKALQASNSH